MTENITTGDIVNYGHEVGKLHETKSTGRLIATWLGIIAAVIIVLALFAIWNRSKAVEKSTDKNTDITLGGNGEAINGLKHEVARLAGYERQDFGKIMFNDGVLYGGCPDRDHGHGGHGCGHGHGRRGDGCTKESFRRVTTFTPGTDSVEIVNTCGGC